MTRPALAIALSFLASALSRAGTPTEASAARGKRIYETGAGSSDREVVAYLGSDRTEVPASVLPCTGCHGADGTGRPEGGVRPSSITWEALSKPYGVAHETGRRHPPYDRESLARSITAGLDPAGHELLLAMPRYDMAPSDLADLLDFLMLLGNAEPQPGVTESAVRVGTLIPDAGPQAEVGRHMSATLAALFEEVNGEGGVFQRRLELHPIPVPAGAGEAELRRLLREEPVFALAGGVAGAAGPRTLALVEEEGIPWVGPLVPDPGMPSAEQRLVFYLLPGIRDQALALSAFANATRPASDLRALILHPDTADGRALAEAVGEQGRESAWASVRTVALAAGGATAALAEQSPTPTAVFFLGPAAELQGILRQATRLGWAPAILVPGSLVGPGIFEVPHGFDGELFLALATAPPSDSPAARECRRLLEAGKSPARLRTFQLWAYAAGRVLAEGLRAAGRDVTRERLVEALERLHDYETGATPRISYGVNRRVGARGASVVRVQPRDATLVPVSDWIRLN